MLSVKSRNILLFGLHKIQNETLKTKILSGSYNFINPLELKLNEKLKEHIIGVLIIDSSEDTNVLYSLPNLKVISCNSSGLDYLDLDLLYSKNVIVKNVPNETSDSTSNIAVMLLLLTSRNVKRAINSLHNPTIYHNRTSYTGHELREQTLGIIGLGAIGKSLAQKACLCFGMKIIYHQRNKNSESDFQYYEDLNGMLKLVDYLCICCPLTRTTKHMIGLAQFKLMKPSAIVINVARGGIIHTDELVEALRSGLIAGAGLDVTDPEPLPSQHPLLFMDNVFLLPHIGTLTHETEQAMVEQALSNLHLYFNGSCD